MTMNPLPDAALSSSVPEAGRQQALQTAALVGIVVNGLLAVVKIVLGWQANSLAVIADGVDTATDVVSALIALWASRVMGRPANPHYPFGYGRAETVATKTISFIIFYAGFQIIVETLTRLGSHDTAPLPTPLAFWAVGLSLAVKTALAVYLWRVSQRHHSELVRANALNTQSDIGLSLGVLVSVVTTQWLQAPLVDLLFALLLGGWIMKSAVEIYWSSSSELMDGNADTALYGDIIRAVDTVVGAHNPHHVRLRKLANLYSIDLHVEVDGHLSVNDGHAICEQVEAAIRAQVHHVYDVNIHLEPLGNEERETFGVCRDTLPPD